MKTYKEKVEEIIDFYDSYTLELNNWEQEFIDSMMSKEEDDYTEKMKTKIDQIYNKN